MDLEERADGLYLGNRLIAVKEISSMVEISLFLREKECPEGKVNEQVETCAGDCNGRYVFMVFDKQGDLKATVGLADIAEPYLRRDIGRKLGLNTDKEIVECLKSPEVVWQDLFMGNEVRGRRAQYKRAGLMYIYTSCSIAFHPGNEKKFEREVDIVRENFERILSYARASPRMNK